MKSRDFNKDLMRRFMKHGTRFNDLLQHVHIMDYGIASTSIHFYNAFNSNDQDSIKISTAGYSANYDDMTANQIDVIEMACEEYSQEVLGFSDLIVRGYFFLLEAILNSDPSPPLPNQGNYLQNSKRYLNVCELYDDKSSIDEPPEVELKDLPPHLEYTFLEGDDKLLIIIAKT
ncbi:hypothetical protein Tco_0692814 [Tanacetum coccineum]